MTCTTPDCGGLVTWVSAYNGVVAHYRCQACGTPYKADAVKMQQKEVPKFAKEAKEMTEKPEAVSIPTKICTRCGNSKPATIEYFHKAAKGKYGVKPVCKTCLSTEARARWIVNGATKKRAYREKMNVVPQGSFLKPKADSVIVVKTNNQDLIATLQVKIKRLETAIEVIRETC